MPRSCSVYRCNMKSGTNLLSQIKFYRFPVEKNRRNSWIAALGIKQWKPSKWSLICSRHFVTGRPSKDPTHPDHIPSLFLGNTKSKPQSKSLVNLNRYERRCRRDEKKPSNLISQVTEELWNQSENNCAQVNEELTNHSENNCVQKSVTISTQPNLNIKLLQLEKERLKKRIDELEKNNENLYQRYINVLQDPYVQILNSNYMLKFYTGISSFKMFQEILQYLLTYSKPNIQSFIPYKYQLLLVLLKLRLGLLTKDLSHHFKISERQFSNIFNEWITILATELQCLIQWPKNNMRNKRKPKVFQSPCFRNLICIIDCTELLIESSSILTERWQTYSHYKHHDTVKFFIAINPGGAIIFLSKLYGGGISDKELIQKCGFLEKIKQGDLILADRGFQIEELLAVKGASLLIPALTNDKSQSSSKEIETSRKISKVRIHVERLIDQLKQFHILQHTIPLSLLHCKQDEELCTADKILITCSALLNLENPAINDDVTFLE